MLYRPTVKFHSESNMQFCLTGSEEKTLQTIEIITVNPILFVHMNAMQSFQDPLCHQFYVFFQELFFKWSAQPPSPYCSILRLPNSTLSISLLLLLAIIHHWTVLRRQKNLNKAPQWPIAPRFYTSLNSFQSITLAYWNDLAGRTVGNLTDRRMPFPYGTNTAEQSESCFVS